MVTLITLRVNTDLYQGRTQQVSTFHPVPVVCSHVVHYSKRSHNNTNHDLIMAIGHLLSSMDDAIAPVETSIVNS